MLNEHGAEGWELDKLVLDTRLARREGRPPADLQARRRFMRILVLGGTVFLGRHVAAEALARGHELTLFTRGLHGADLFPEAEQLRGDRSQRRLGAARPARGTR